MRKQIKLPVKVCMGGVVIDATGKVIAHAAGFGLAVAEALNASPQVVRESNARAERAQRRADRDAADADAEGRPSKRLA